CSNGTFSVVAGGTSAAAPLFSGVLALVNQYVVAHHTQQQPGLGNVNPTLYQLAQSQPSAWHDITSGSNIVPCEPSSPDCETGSYGYLAGAGYDQVTGLGSIDGYALVTNWNSITRNPTSSALSADPVQTLAGGNVLLTVQVSATAGGGIPTGS